MRPRLPSRLPARLRRTPLRTRLVGGFVAAMLVLLTAAGAFVYWRVEYALDRGLDSQLREASTTIDAVVDDTGHLTSPATANATGAGWQVLSPDGTVRDSGGAAPSTPMVTTRDLSHVGSEPVTVELGGFLLDRNDPYRVRLSKISGTDDYLLVGVRRGARDEALRELLLQLSLAGLGSLIIAAVVGDLLARAALRPVEQYRRRAAQIASGADGLRLDVPAERDDEVTRLGHTLNEMLTELERSLEHERRFVNDASHELRTPLTLLRSRIQLTLRRPRTIGEHEVALHELSVDVTRLGDLAEQLLELGTTTNQHPATSDVDLIVSTVVARRRAADPEAGRDIHVERGDGVPAALIDPHSLERVVTNLIENAFTHGQSPVAVRVTAPTPGWVQIQVEDSGRGMPPELLDTATQRFTRAAEARNRPGAGLGLALVEQIVNQAHGELRLCHAGTHISYGTPKPVACGHARAMTVSVLLRSAASDAGSRRAG